MTPWFFRAGAVAVLLLGADCRRGEVREPVAEPTEVEIEWPDAGPGSSDTRAAPEPADAEAGKISSDPE